MRGVAYYAQPIFGFLNIFDKKFLKAKGQLQKRIAIFKQKGSFNLKKVQKKRRKPFGLRQ